MKAECVKSNIPTLDIYVTPIHNHTNPCQISFLHYHDELEFIPVYRGTFQCTVDGVKYIAKTGDIIFVNAGIPHETFLLEEGTQTALLQFRESSYINTEIRKIIKYSVKIKNLEGAPVRILRSDEIMQAIDEIIRESEEKKSSYEIIIRSCVLKIIGLLYRDGILSDGEQVYASSSVQKILPAMEYINLHYSEDITLESISSLMGFDRSYFCRLFKVATGATFTEYLNFVRICKSEKMLSSSTKSILDISADVGFCSVSYFNKVFKKYKNCSPGFYRTAKNKNI